MRVGARRLLAVLAGGVVLVGGGVTTLASWQDQGLVKTPLTLSAFNVQQFDGTSWSENDTVAGALQLALSVNTVLAAPLTPGNATTGWVGLRADQNSLGGTVVLSGATLGTDTAGLASHLTYQAVAGVDAATCKAGTLPASGAGVTVLVDNAALTTGSAAGTSFTLPVGTGGAYGATVGVCIKVKVDAGLPRSFSGTSLTPVWTFNATSTN